MIVAADDYLLVGAINLDDVERRSSRYAQPLRWPTVKL